MLIKRVAMGAQTDRLRILLPCPSRRVLSGPRLRHEIVGPVCLESAYSIQNAISLNLMREVYTAVCHLREPWLLFPQMLEKIPPLVHTGYTYAVVLISTLSAILSPPPPPPPPPLDDLKTTSPSPVIESEGRY